jgi:hypothetical protein
MTEKVNENILCILAYHSQNIHDRYEENIPPYDDIARRIY